MTATVDRRDLLDAASRVLAEEGLAALTMRRIAREVGASTMVLYTHFGDKDGLVEALLAEGFRRFAEALRAVERADPWEHLKAIGQAYRRFALANPTYYRLLWSHPRPEDVAERFGEARRHGQVAFSVLTEAVTRVLAALDRPAREVLPAAVQVWSAVHGHVSLELTGELPPDELEELYAGTLAFIARGLGRPG